MKSLHSYRYTEAAQSLQVSKVVQTTVLGSQNYFPVTGKKIENTDPNIAFILYNI